VERIIKLILYSQMGNMYITYSIALFFNGVLATDLLSFRNSLNIQDSPYRLAFYGLIIIAIVYLIAMTQTRSLIRTKKILKEKDIAINVIESQKFELEQREKDLTDSIMYAKRIQEALLPSEDYFRKHFKDAFIFYKPKDIVSGDFYWIEEKGENLFIVAADCTGHGVPGALMSIIGLEMVGKTINEDNIVIPSKILAVLNKGLEKIFSGEKNIGTIIRDGMDIGLCVIDRKKRKIQYSGAFLPLYLIRNNSLTEIKADKIIIGMNPENTEYTDHELDLKEDDIFYLFSDGYADQFGGVERKKFMYRRFRYLLLTIHNFPVANQKSILEENISSWMGKDNQVDDIMVIGFKPFVDPD
jgi:serine phosphatase RsbU (regulator of sigma subunit)